MLLAGTIIVLLILLTALYVAAEFAAVGVRRSRLRRLAEDGNALAARMLPVVEDPAELDRYIAVSQIGITLSSLILGAYGQAALAPTVVPLLERVGGHGRRDRRRSTAAISILAGADLPGGDPRRAGAEVARASEPDPGRAGDRAADAVVAAALRPVDLVSQRQRHADPACPARSAHRPSARPLARGDRAADRREPRRRAARTGGAGPAAPGAAARAAHRRPADGPARAPVVDRCRDAVSRSALRSFRRAPTAGCRSTKAARSTWSAFSTRRMS